MSKVMNYKAALRVAVLTVSDTRDASTDTSGAYLVESLQAAGHTLESKQIVKDDIYQIRAIVSAWVTDAAIQSILITGGTGFSGRDSTPEAVRPLFDKTIDGFGELFRMLSYEEIGAAAMLSRAVGGIAGDKVLFSLPGSTNAVKLGMTKLILPQVAHLVHELRKHAAGSG